MSSQKIKLGKVFIIAWAVLIGAFIVTIASVLPECIEYRKGQERAVELFAERTGEDFEGGLKSVADDLYEQYTGPITFSGENGERLRKYYDKVNIWVGEKLSEEGFKCVLGTAYLKYTGTSIFYHFESFGLSDILIFFTYILLILNIWYAINIKKAIFIENEKIMCKKGKKTVREFFIRDIKSVELAPLKGLRIRGNGVNYYINLLTNAEILKNTIINALSSIQVENKTASNESKHMPFTSNAEEIKKYKELLDMGVISQDEFEMKKKQLLSK